MLKIEKNNNHKLLIKLNNQIISLFDLEILLLDFGIIIEVAACLLIIYHIAIKL